MCVKDGVWQSCVWKMVCDNVVCVCERWCVTKSCVTQRWVWQSCVWQSCVCVKDGVWQSCVKDGVWQRCVWQSCVWQRCMCVCVTKLRVPISARPATQNKNLCRQAQCLPSKTNKVNVAKCHACHAKRRWMSPSATPATWNDGRCRQVRRLPRKSAAASRRPSAPPEPASPIISTTPATPNEGGCHQVSHLPRETKADVAKRHACHAKCRGDHGVKRDPSASPEPAQSHKHHAHHACHAKRRWMSPSATPATWNKGRCRQVPRLPRKSAAVSRRPSAPPEPAQSHKYHACHAKRRWMSPSATPATWNDKVVTKLLCVTKLYVTKLYVTKLCVTICMWQSCVCVWQSGVCVWQSCVCVWQSCVCDKVVCDKVVCVWQSFVWKLCVCVTKLCVTKLCVTKLCVTKLCVTKWTWRRTRRRRSGARDGGCRSKNKNPTQSLLGKIQAPRGLEKKTARKWHARRPSNSRIFSRILVWPLTLRIAWECSTWSWRLVLDLSRKMILSGAPPIGNQKKKTWITWSRGKKNTGKAHWPTKVVTW